MPKSAVGQTKPDWNQSMFIFFSPKLSLEGKNLLPQIIQPVAPLKQPSFLSVFKKPIGHIYDKMLVKKEKNAAVFVIGEPKFVEKRTQTTEVKRRVISSQLVQQFKRRRNETLKNAHPIPRSIVSRDPTQQKPQAQVYYYLIGPGNNCELVAQILSLRKCWVPTTSSLYHFRWEQARPRYQMNLYNKHLVNHLPNHEVITDKVGLVNSLKGYCEKEQEQVFGLIPVCYFFDFNNLEACEAEIKKFIDFYVEQNTPRPNSQLQERKEQRARSRTSMQKSRNHETLPSQKLGKYETSNRSHATTITTHKSFRTSKKHNTPLLYCQEAARKQQVKALHRALLAKLKAFYNFVDMSALKKQSPFLRPINSQVYGSTSLWLLKPADLNRGRGIHLFRSIEELGSLLASQLAKNEKGSFLVQKYIEKPMLINARKFDIRMYALVTQAREVFFFRQGYIRTSSTPFRVESQDYFTHLTNNAIQKHSKTYGEFEEGNILPLAYLFKQCAIDQPKFLDEVKSRATKAIKSGMGRFFACPEKSTRAYGGSSSEPYSAGSFANPKMKCFEIFGFDFMLDETGYIWLIEVNTNPCIELSNSWLRLIIPRMLDDAFKLTLDKMFPCTRPSPNPEQQSSTRYSVPGYPDEASMWQPLDLDLTRKGPQLPTSC